LCSGEASGLEEAEVLQLKTILRQALVPRGKQGRDLQAVIDSV
jgi:hypothetical protein